MRDAKTWVVAAAALLVGAGSGYSYGESRAGDLAERVTVLQADLGVKVSMIEEQRDRIFELQDYPQR